MKKIFIFLFVFYLSVINCQHDIDFEEKMNFIDEALDSLIQLFDGTSDNCDYNFNATLTFGVLFTNEENFTNDLNEMKNFFSTNVTDYLANNETERGLIDETINLDNTTQKLFVYKNTDHDNDKYSFLMIEANLTNFKYEDLNCSFVVAVSTMFNDFDFDINDLANTNYKVVSFKYN